MPKELVDFLLKVWTEMISPALLVVVGTAITVATVRIVSYLNSLKTKDAIAETVAAVEQTSPGVSGDAKLAEVMDMLDVDPRVKDFTREAIEAAVHALPEKHKLEAPK